ncbi:flagellar export protein FliJ [Pseudidiomarina sp. CB1]|uniref:flagellar export protein FliJ n=1 Tax=Pseudidiomarina sp. CB1 TaxID=2972484 RepID=UPI0021629561|nr:flagellar export protein FliJ [Pseudidiomarina sp. CB1]
MNSVALAHLTEQAEKARTQAAQLLAEDRNNKEKIAQQLQMLQQYRHEYALQLQQQMRIGIQSTMLGTYRAFLASLDRAIAQAQEALAQNEERIAKSKQKWLEKQRRWQSFDLLQERQHTSIKQQRERAEQRQNDELSLTMYLRHRRKTT